MELLILIIGVLSPHKKSNLFGGDSIMATTTTNLGLTKPGATDNTLIREDMNNNSDLIDAGVQMLDAGLTSIAALTTAADKMIYTTALDTYAVASLTAFARTILDDANEATFKATVNLEIGTDVQAYDASLTSISALTYVSGSYIALTVADTYTVRTYAQVLSDIGAANSGANSSITSLTGLTTPLGAAYGGTGVANAAGETITLTGGFALDLTLSAATAITLPTTGTVAVTANKLSAFAATTSAELAGVISDETGSGLLVFGTSPTFAGNVKRSVQIGITAFATGGQASAVLITADIAEISVCATAADSVKLPSAVAGLVVLITNHGAAAANVFPNTDDAINEAAVNTAKSLGIDASMLCIAYDATNWECLTLTR